MPLLLRAACLQHEVLQRPQALCRCYDVSGRQEKERDPESDARRLLDEMFKDDAVVARAVLRFSQDNPPTAKYKRKQLINWAEYRRSFGVVVEAAG